jgi:hypothetical protein
MRNLLINVLKGGYTQHEVKLLVPERQGGSQVGGKYAPAHVGAQPMTQRYRVLNRVDAVRLMFRMDARPRSLAS